MVTLKDVMTWVNGELLTPDSPLDLECPKIFASDLMSDVLTSAEPGSLLMTGLVNPHVIRTACLADLAAVVFVQGKRPDAEVLRQAGESRLPLIVTRLTMFDACSRLAGLFGEGGRGR